MSTASRWFAPALLAVGLGIAALSPAPARAQGNNDLVRVLVDVADVVLRGNTPYYRNGDYGYDDRLIVERNRYGQPVYYRQVARTARNAPPYGNAYGYHRNTATRQVKCNKHGKCKATYYDPRYDRDGRRDEHRYDDRYSRYDRDDRRRGRDRDDD
ncbi:MAG: hypothetical protein ACREPE_08755 [Lysobacter sp.]